MKKLILYATILVLFPLALAAKAPRKVWAKTYGGDNEDVGKTVIQTSDGGYAIIGFTYSFGPGASNYEYNI